MQGVPCGKTDFFDPSTLTKTKPMHKKQLMLAGTYNFNGDQGPIGRQPPASSDLFPYVASKNMVSDRRKKLEDLIAQLDQRQAWI